MNSAAPRPADRPAQRAVGAMLLALGLATLIRLPAAPLAPGVNAGVVNINRADADELQLLPGLGPALARRIAADRALHGPFREVGDLARVKGVGERTVKGLRDFTAVSD